MLKFCVFHLETSINDDEQQHDHYHCGHRHCHHRHHHRLLLLYAKKERYCSEKQQGTEIKEVKKKLKN